MKNISITVKLSEKDIKDSMFLFGVFYGMELVEEGFMAKIGKELAMEFAKIAFDNKADEAEAREMIKQVVGKNKNQLQVVQEINADNINTLADKIFDELE